MNRSHASNVFWSGSEAAISASLSFVSAFVVARLVGPAEVGIGAAAVAVHVLLWVGVNALFADALVQRSEVDDTTFSTAFVMSALVGCGAALAQVAAAHPLAWSLSDHRLVTMSLLLAVPLPLVGAAGPIQGLLTRQRAYRALAFRTVIGQGLGTLGRDRQRAGRCRSMGAGVAAVRHLRRRCTRLAVADSDPAGPHCQLAQVARTGAHWPAADRQHAGLPLPLPAVRIADRRHRRRGDTRPGTHGVPPDRRRSRVGLHRAMAADAPDALGATARSACTARS